MQSKIFWLPAFLALAMIGVPSSFAQSVQPAECESEVCYIEITSEGFAPDRLVINAGTTAVWKNTDEKVHAITSYSSNGEMLFNSTLLKTGEVFEFTFTGHNLGFHEYVEVSTGAAGQIEVAPNLGNYSLASVPVDYSSPASGIKGIALLKGNVTGVQLMPELDSMLVNIQANSSDVLRLSLDRRLIDATEGGEDAEFDVLANERAVGYREVTTSSERMLSIPISKNVKTVQITGTSTSTEFIGYDDAKATIDDADAVVSGYRQAGIVMTDADDLLLQAKEAFATGKYPFAHDLASEAVDIAHGASRAATAAVRAMDEAELSINATRTFGIDVADAEEMLLHTKEVYAYGGYDEALNLAVQARLAAASKADPLVLVAAIAAPSAAAAYIYHRRHAKHEPPQADPQPAVPAPETAPPVAEQANLEQVFADKPYLREDDRNVLSYVVEKGGEVLLAEIRQRFDLPKSTAWRLVKRLEREELVEIVKFGNQNLVRCALKKQEK